MRHRVQGRKLGRTMEHRRALLRNMVTSLIEQERLTTTLPRAKELRRFAERMITLGKRGTLHARRQAAAYVRTPAAVQKLFSDLATRFEGRAGGYTRITKTGTTRYGDAAPLALIEYLGAPLKASREERRKAKAERHRHTETEQKSRPKVRAATKEKAAPDKKAGAIKRSMISRVLRRTTTDSKSK